MKGQGPIQASLAEAERAHKHVIEGTHNDKGNAEKHFKAAHAQVMGKKAKKP